MTEKGLYTGRDETSFLSDDDIRRKLALEGQLPIHHDLKEIPSFSRRMQVLQERTGQMKELSPRADNQIDVRLPRTSTVNVMSDLHLGHPDTDNERICREVEAIKNTPDSYVIFGGDVVDGIHWGGASQAEQSANLGEQRGLLRALFSELKGRVIVGVSGEHDSKWAAKTGSDPYDEFQELTGAPYVRGVAEVNLGVGEQDYKLVVQHKAKGHSMYNKNHPTYRESRFSLQGADVYISGHTHQKQVSQEAVREFGGRAREVTHISTGAYKRGDEYGQRGGYPDLEPQEMGGVALRFHDDKKKVEVEPDILTAQEKWSK